MILEIMIEKDRISINSSRFPKVTGPFEVEYKLKFKILMTIIKIPTSCQTLEIKIKFPNVNFESFSFHENIV